MEELTDKELKDIISSFLKDGNGNHDWDFSKEALLSQLILDIRELTKEYRRVNRLS